MLDIPETKQMLAQLGWDTSKVTFSKQTRGNTNTSFLCQYQGKQYIYRQASSHSAILSIDRSKEYEVLTVLCNWEHANHPLYYNIINGNMLCPLLPGTPVTAPICHSTRYLMQSAQLLRQLHQHTCSHLFNPFSDIQKWFFFLSQKNYPLSHSFVNLYQHCCELSKMYFTVDTQYLGLCHNDCYNSNFIYNSNRFLYLIDYEYAGMGDVFFDLACICCNAQSALSPIEQQFLLKSYFGQCNENLFAKLKDYIFLQLFWNSCLAYIKSFYQQAFIPMADTFLDKAKQYSTS